jgi:hypothetical protein
MQHKPMYYKYAITHAPEQGALPQNDQISVIAFTITTLEPI